MQYIIGEWDFLDMTLIMKPPVLIPRPETEVTVKPHCEKIEPAHDKTYKMACAPSEDSDQALPILIRVFAEHSVAS